MMESIESQICQCHCIPQLSIGIIEAQPNSTLGKLKLFLKRNLSDSNKRKIKKIVSNSFRIFGHAKTSKSSTSIQENTEPQHFSAGDLVRVRSEEEIRNTLTPWNELNGCMFMEAQRQYCNTTQRVLKTVERFVDERDYRVKKTRGLVLLEGILCEGTPEYGRCDRACFYFWREEWLEKID